MLKGAVFTAAHRAAIAAARTGTHASAETRAKMSAAKLGKPKSLETRARMSAAKIGYRHSDEAKAKMSAAKKGKPGRKLTDAERERLRITNTGRSPSVDTRAKMRAAKLGRPGPWAGKKRGPQSAEARAKIGASNRKPKPAGFGEKVGRAIVGHRAYHARGKQFWYGSIRMRSSYEVRVARILDALMIRWEYEPRRFALGERTTWRPDFFLCDADSFWEVKGYYGPRSRNIVSRFREQYPDVPAVAHLQGRH